MAACSAMKTISDVLVLVQEQCRACMELCAHQTVRTAGYVEWIDEYIEKHYSEPDLSVSSISERLHLSAVYTGTLYKQHKLCHSQRRSFRVPLAVVWSFSVSVLKRER